MKDYINAIKHIIYKELMPDVTDEMRVKMVQAVIREIVKEAVGEMEDLQSDIADVNYSLTLDQLNMEKVRQTVHKSIRNQLRSEILSNIEKVIGGK